MWGKVALLENLKNYKSASTYYVYNNKNNNNNNLILTHKVPTKPCIGGVPQKLPTNSAFTPMAGLEEGIRTAQSSGTNPAGSESGSNSSRNG